MEQFKDQTIKLRINQRNRSMPSTFISTNIPIGLVLRSKSQSSLKNIHSRVTPIGRSFIQKKLEFPKRLLSDIGDISIQFFERPRDDLKSLDLPNKALQNALRPISPIYSSPNKNDIKQDLAAFVELENKKEEEENSRRDFSYHSSDDEKSIIHYPTKFISRASKIFIPPFLDDQRSECEDFRASNILSNRNIDPMLSNEQVSMDKSEIKIDGLRSTKSHTNSEIIANNSRRSPFGNTGKLNPSISSPSYKLNSDELRKDISNADMRLSIIQESMAKQDAKIAAQNNQLQEYFEQIRKLDLERKAIDQGLMNCSQSIQSNRTLYDYLLQYLVSVPINANKKFY
jgi:hypothetical protein